jgi:hypothetical protein
MVALRAFVSALQTAEENRLRTEIVALAPGSPGRVAADALVLDLRRARNAAESHGSASTSGWGTVLRAKWLAPRKKILDLLGAAEKEAARLAKEGAAQEGEGAAPTPAGGPPPGDAPAPGAPGTPAPGPSEPAPGSPPGGPR